ncbi:hypothetical protein AURDEDRAFT_167580 [Auricularia subglabra TFB-10046 SS5]|nr:hypothetical protein AURDEDRAFT_167580 [Auricularia subglabra TFB-10046 SS5]
MEGVDEVRSVHFLDRQTILAAALDQGDCALYDLADRTRPLWRRRLGHRIGESAISPDGRYLALTNLANAVQIHEITPTGIRLFRTFESPVDMACNYPLQVCFAEAQNKVVSGSGNGEVRLWDISDGKKETLMHSSSSRLPLRT